MSDAKRWQRIKAQAFFNNSTICSLLFLAYLKFKAAEGLQSRFILSSNFKMPPIQLRAPGGRLLDHLSLEEKDGELVFWLLLEN